MGDMADDAEIEFLLRQLRLESKEFWRTKDGTRIRYSDMTRSHIENCIMMMNRNLSREERENSLSFQALNNELIRREKLNE